MNVWQQLWWHSLAATALLLALFGVVLPGLPTTPFLLLAAWAGSRAWPRLEQWLLAHPAVGPSIRRWRARRAVPRRAKWLASAMMALSLATMIVVATAPWLVATVALLLLAVGSWIWSRPDE